ncbi:MAG TPA: hypothetical protein VMH23_09065, partial [Bacteroidota bacterium]|nr:hypothetical protein [Bacteroidota bacterium]
ASTLARLVRAGSMGKVAYLNPSVIKEALRCCRAIISKCNYDSIPLSELHDVIPKEMNNVMFVAGAQDGSVRDARVITAFECAKRLHNINFTFALAGLRPPPPKPVRAKDESREMRILLEELIEKQGLATGQLGPRIVEIASENEFQTTKENIQKLFEGNVLDSRKQNNIFISSSTFHLIRLSREFETYLSKYEGPFQIRHIVLIGAEDEGEPLTSVAQLHNYVKAMFFDIFDYLLEQSKQVPVPYEKIPPLLS